MKNGKRDETQIEVPKNEEVMKDTTIDALSVDAGELKAPNGSKKKWTTCHRRQLLERNSIRKSVVEESGQKKQNMKGTQEPTPIVEKKGVTEPAQRKEDGKRRWRNLLPGRNRAGNHLLR